MIYGKVNILKSERSAHALMSLAAKMRSECPILFVDCANSFDPYYLFRACRDENVLDRVYVSRPFTVYQLRELVFGKLEKAIQSLSSRVLLISGVDCYKADSPLDDEEYGIIQERVYKRIESLTRDYNIYTVVSYGGVQHGPDG